MSQTMKNEMYVISAKTHHPQVVSLPQDRGKV